jgi:RecA-family ATPase
MDNVTLEWALHYASHGYRVIPIKPKEKRPPMGAWQDVATTHTGTIQAWWTGQFADYGIGIVTGALDDGTRYIVLDIDNKNNNIGQKSLEKLQKQHGQLPDTIQAITGGGGTHLLYRLRDHHQMPGNGAGRYLGEGIDIRGHNAQIVVTPTQHPNGNLYEWTEGHAIGETTMAYAPDWLLNLLNPPQQQPTSTPVTLDNGPDERPGTKFNRSTTWDSLLTADGWTPHHHDPTTDTYYWTRPNKNTRDGISATVNHNGNDSLTVFTTSIHNLPPGSYDRFGYWTQTRHRGDFAEAARQLAQQNDNQIEQWVRTIQNDSRPQLDIDTGQPTDQDPLATWYVNWPTLWDSEQQQGEWICEPILARGRAHALYAGAKSGKSLLLLEIAAALATGRAILNNPARDPIDVLYIDYEMTAADVRDRLEAYGYNREDNLDHLHYVLLPSISGLDTRAGAEAVIAAIQQKNIQLVIIDTTARAVEGEENDADTMRSFYRWTGVAMKSLGVTWIRADHAGKDTSKGQRGTSAKNDDVDIVWRFTKRNTTNILMEATHRRMQWVPEKIELELREIAGNLQHTLIGDEISEASIQLAKTLDDLGAADDISARAARQLLKDNNIRSASDILRAALRTRRGRFKSATIETWVETIERVGTFSGTYPSNSGTPNSGTPAGTPTETASGRGGTFPAHSGTLPSGDVPPVPRSKERHGDGTPTQQLNLDQIDDWL